MPLEHAGGVAADERAYAAKLLTRYPGGLTPREEEHLANWFDRVATPFDLHALASDPRVRAQYKVFRKDHGQGTGPITIGRVLLTLGVATTVMGALSLLAP